MLGAIFDPFGRIDKVEIAADASGQKYGYVSFRHAEDATRALEQLNGFELAGRPMAVTTVDEDDKQRLQDQRVSSSNGRQQLMAKLAKGTEGG